MRCDHLSSSLLLHPSIHLFPRLSPSPPPPHLHTPRRCTFLRTGQVRSKFSYTPSTSPFYLLPQSPSPFGSYIPRLFRLIFPCNWPEHPYLAGPSWSFLGPALPPLPKPSCQIVACLKHWGWAFPFFFFLLPHLLAHPRLALEGSPRHASCSPIRSSMLCPNQMFHS